MRAPTNFESQQALDYQRRKYKMKKAFRLFLAALLVFTLSGAPAFAQVTSNLATVNLSMNIGETFTLAASPANISFTYSSGAATASGPITVTSSWGLTHAANHTIVIDAFFTTPSAALSGPANIPASSVFASVDGAAAVACSGTEGNPNMPFATAGGVCPHVLANATEPDLGSSSDTVLLSLSGLSGAPGNYTGTLNIQGYAN
jgi:hypothetical protein